MKLGEIIYTRQNIEKLVHTQLLAMDVWFQNHLWDGYSDEDDPKFISNEDFEAIQALTDKIKHMTLNIGCGISVEPMLQSICERKIKHWQGEPLFYGGMDKKGWIKGKQLKTKDNINLVKKCGSNEGTNWKYIISGHFRWNNRGYILSRRATDLLNYYYEHIF
jgi:hypothetical protein